MGFHESNSEIETTGMTPSPYMRANKAGVLTLTTSFQRVVYDGTSTRNTNTFPILPMTNPSASLVYWDTTSNVFRFNNTDDKHFDVIANFRINCSALLSLVALTMATVQFRFVVPSPTPRYFPLPDDGAFVDLVTTGLVSNYRVSMPYIVRAIADVRQYGIGIELALSGAVLGTITVQSADFSIYGR